MRLSLQESVPGIGTALCYASSPVLVRFGLREGSSPLLAVTVGLCVATVVYFFLFLLPVEARTRGGPLFGDAPHPGIRLWGSREALFQLLAALSIGLGTWFRYVAVDLASLALVATLGRVNILVVLLLTPLLLRGKQHRLTWATWIGAVMIILGTILVAVA
ncbi:MAG: EamA family transporter [Alkalispirochaetaceae bacterium]